LISRKTYSPREDQIGGAVAKAKRATEHDEAALDLIGKPMRPDFGIPVEPPVKLRMILPRLYRDGENEIVNDGRSDVELSFYLFLKDCRGEFGRIQQSFCLIVEFHRPMN
jgi:hypothetical protein